LWSRSDLYPNLITLIKSFKPNIKLNKAKQSAVFIKITKQGSNVVNCFNCEPQGIPRSHYVVRGLWLENPHKQPKICGKGSN
jgi:hypothetical protein